MLVLHSEDVAEFVRNDLESGIHLLSAPTVAAT